MDWILIGIVSFYNVFTLWKDVKDNVVLGNNDSIYRNNPVRPIEIPQVETLVLQDKQ